MFSRQRKDRRRGYSFRGHFRRVLETKGLRHVVLSVGGTLLLTAGTLAYCSSDSITGPPPPRALTSSAASQSPRGSNAGQATPTSNIVGDNNSSESRLPYEGREMNCMNGELVPFRGHMAFALFVSDGDVTHKRLQTSYVFDGTGSLGHVYHGSGGQTDILNVSVLPMTWTVHHRVRMTSRTAPDMHFSMKFHITISGTGKPTAFVEKTSTNCDDVTG
jgi:hypothetical protein